ncbi:MAG: SPASM domain-containing protein [Coriobacteriales bacterium]|jgi:radical SAM protein with 4Fe4S-binding SPASM domain|nr:SPASM domain-containing protein [Coriobacteriales bacterium]
MTLADFNRIAEQCVGRVNQFALGGRGDPDLHENFEQVLKMCRDNNIVPNYTTSGYRLSDSAIAASKKYCGAVAVSWYRTEYTINAIERFLSADVKTNISCYIDSEMSMSPCSFDRSGKYAVSLKDTTIAEVWQSPQFECFREHLRNACPQCESRSLCMGGCPIVPEIVLCANHPHQNKLAMHCGQGRSGEVDVASEPAKF